MITLDRMNLEDERAILEARNKALAVSKYCDQSETQSCLLVTFCSELARRLIADGDPAQFTILAGKQGEQFGFYVFFSGNEICFGSNKEVGSFLTVRQPKDRYDDNWVRAFRSLGFFTCLKVLLSYLKRVLPARK